MNDWKWLEEIEADLKFNLEFHPELMSPLAFDYSMKNMKLIISSGGRFKLRNGSLILKKDGLLN